MPIVVKDFSWWQTERQVFVKVQIPHISKKKSDVLTSNKYLKVSDNNNVYNNCIIYIFIIYNYYNDSNIAYSGVHNMDTLNVQIKITLFPIVTAE